jgi:hypothetical protein
MSELLEGTQLDKLEFPLDFYPQREQELMLELHESKGLSLQHVGLGMLPVFGRIYSKYRGRSYNGYEISPVFWVMIVDRPGTSKSEALKSWYRELNRFNDYSDPERYVFYTANDVTPEGLVHHIGDTEDGIYLFYDEITRFTGGMGQYKKNNDTDKGFWLGLYNADVDESQMRVGQLRKFKKQPVCVSGTTQPDTLRQALKNDLKNGFFERFLFSVESNKMPKLSRTPNYSIGEDIKTRIEHHMQFPKFNAPIKYSPEAFDMMHHWHQEKNDEYEDSDIKRQFWSKDVVYVNRFAMLTSILYKEGDTAPITVADAERAIKLYDFCSEMKYRAYEIVSDDAMAIEDMFDIKTIAKHLEDKYPNINRAKFADSLGIDRQIFYR